MAPQLVVVSWFDGTTRGLVKVEDAEPVVRKWLLGPEFLVAHNASFDSTVLCNAFPEHVHLWFDKYHRGEVGCTMLLAQLHDIANGCFRGSFDDSGTYRKRLYNLSDCHQRLFGTSLEKDVWRMRYEEFLNVPLSQWPQGAKAYSELDALAAFRVGAALGPVNDWARQSRYDFCLKLCSIWGLRTDIRAVESLRDHLLRERAGLEQLLRELRLVRSSGQKNTKAIRARVRSGGGSKLTKTGLLAIDAEACEGLDDAALKIYSKWSVLGTTLAKDVPMLRLGETYPIHTSFGLADSGRTTSAKPNCFSGDTEVLTRRGWVDLRTYVESGNTEEVAQFHTESQTISFTAPIGRVVARDEVLHIKSDIFVNLKVTKNHRCLLQNRKTSKWRVFEGANYPSDHKQHGAGTFVGGTTHLSDDEVVVLAAVQADGSYLWHGRSAAIRFAFSKQRKVERLKSALENLGVKFRLSKADARGKQYFYIPECDLVRYVQALMPQKNFGWWVLDLDRATLDKFVNEIWFWDGCSTRNSHYSSNAIENAEIVQAACALSGISCKIRKYHSHLGANTNYQVDRKHKSYSLTTNTRTESLGEQDVFCVSVPSSYLLVRTEGVISVTGNCQNFGRSGGVRGCFIPRQGFLFAAVDFPGLELRTVSQVLLEKVGWSKLASRINSGEDPHIAVAAIMAGVSYEDAFRLYNEADSRISELRQFGKAANFGFPGGMSAKTLQASSNANPDLRKKGITMTLLQAEELREAWLAANPEFHEYFRFIRSLMRADGLYDVQHLYSGRWRRGCKYTEAANTLFQGLGADVAKHALWLVQRACYAKPESPLYNCRTVLFVHDEVVCEVPESDPIPPANELSRLMTVGANKLLTKVPLETTPVLMRQYGKYAKPKFNEQGVMIPW
jgi:hypothetical protein